MNLNKTIEDLTREINHLHRARAALQEVLQFRSGQKSKRGRPPFPRCVMCGKKEKECKCKEGFVRG